VEEGRPTDCLPTSIQPLDTLQHQQSSFNDLKSSFDNNDLPSVGKQLPQVKVSCLSSSRSWPYLVLPLKPPTIN
jgi:hypothetical protein